MDNFKSRIAFCYSNNHHMVPTQFWKSFGEMIKPSGYLKSHGACSVKESSINESIYNALEKKPEWIFNMDVDQLFPVHTIVRLLDTAEKHDAKIVSVLYHRGLSPYSPVAGWSKKNEETGEVDPVNALGNDWRKQYAFPDTGVVEVDWVGAGGLLIHSDVFKKLKGPRWFRDEYKEDSYVRSLGHDITFCNRAREAGFKIYVDTAVQSAHGKFTYYDTTFAKTYNRVHFDRERERILHETTLTKDYWDTIHHTENVQNLNWRSNMLKDTYSQIAGMIPEGSVIADVGCGRGDLMKRLRDEKKVICTGYDFSDSAIKEVKQNGFEANVMDVRTFSLNGEKKKFDVVVGSHILEHIQDDHAFVELLKGMAKPDGRVILATPHVPEIQNISEHCRSYDQNELIEFMKSHFDEIELHKNNRDLVAVGVLNTTAKLTVA